MKYKYRQKVICISNDLFQDGAFAPPVVGEVYTIRRIWSMDNDRQLIGFMELERSRMFTSEAFRPYTKLTKALL